MGSRNTDTGREGMLGLSGKAETPLDPEGLIKVHGELWQAICSPGGVSVGDLVRVVRVDGLKLHVEREK
ncbi:MAG: hypothetical protein NTU41_04095 [Chloroflexi bacterium]|nr:hypothetical protein [Chloroflexota bacterium]